MLIFYNTVLVSQSDLLQKTKNKQHCMQMLGLDRTGHMSFLTGPDRTPKFAGQVLPDRTESGLIFLDNLPYK